MAHLMFIIIILPIAASAIWWYFFVFQPLQRNRFLLDIYSTKLLFFFTVNVSTVIYAAIAGAINGHIAMIYTVIFTAIMPPVAMLIAIIMLFDVHFVAFGVTIILLLIGCYVALRKTRGMKRVAIALLAIIPICTLPLTIQGYVSIAKIKSEYARMGGECLSHGTFVRSLKNAGGSSGPIHAVMIKGDMAYIWSYKKQMFVDSGFGVAWTLSYSPNSNCEVYGRSHE